MNGDETTNDVWAYREEHWDAMLAQRLADIARPENQGRPWDKLDQVGGFVLGVLLPLVAVVLGWVLYG